MLKKSAMLNFYNFTFLHQVNFPLILYRSKWPLMPRDIHVGSIGVADQGSEEAACSPSVAQTVHANTYCLFGKTW